MSIHALLFWLLCAGVLVIWYQVGSQAARLFMQGRGVRPGRTSRPLAGLAVGLYAAAVYGALAALLGCPYLETLKSNGLAQIVASSPVALLVLALAARLWPVIAGMGRGEPAVIVVDAEPADERTFTEPTSTTLHEAADERQEVEPEARRPFAFDRDTAEAWAEIDARLRRAAA